MKNSMIKSQNFLRILGWLLVIIVPLSLISFTYLNAFFTSRKVTFDDTSVGIDRFIAYDELVDLEIIIDWNSYDAPTKDSQGEWVNGKYEFHISYTNLGITPVYNVYVLPVLQMDWTDIHEVGELKPISYSSITSFIIDFNHPLPQNPLYFIEVQDPILYLKISYQVEVNGSLVTKVKYVEYPLHDVFPNN